MSPKYRATIIHGKCGRDIRECTCPDAGFPEPQGNEAILSALAALIRHVEQLQRQAT